MRKFYLQANDQQDLVEWISVLNNAIKITVSLTHTHTHPLLTLFVLLLCVALSSASGCSKWKVTHQATVIKISAGVAACKDTTALKPPAAAVVCSQLTSFLCTLSPFQTPCLSIIKESPNSCADIDARAALAAAELSRRAKICWVANGGSCRDARPAEMTPRRRLCQQMPFSFLCAPSVARATTASALASLKDSQHRSGYVQTVTSPQLSTIYTSAKVLGVFSGVHPRQHRRC